MLKEAAESNRENLNGEARGHLFNMGEQYLC